jgi:hypothetical protein
MKIQVGTQSRVDVQDDRTPHVNISQDRYDHLLDVEQKYNDLREKQIAAMKARTDTDWDEALHPRDQSGKFASDATADRLVLQAKASGGFTHHPTKGTPTSGYIVSSDTKEKRGKIVDLSDSNVDVKAEVSAYLRKNEGNLGPNEYICGHVQNTKDGKPLALHLDISNHFADKGKAIRLGQQRNQISVLDVVKQEEILTGGTGREPSSEKPYEPQTKEAHEERRLAQEDEDYEQLAKVSGEQAYKRRSPK